MKYALLALVLACAPARAAWSSAFAAVNVGNAGSGASMSGAWGTNVTAGQLLTASIYSCSNSSCTTDANSGRSLTAISDTVGSTWHVPASCFQGVSFFQACIVWAIAGGSGANTLSVTMSGVGANIWYLQAQLAAWTGGPTAGNLEDQQNSAVTIGSSTPTVSTSSATAQTGELILSQVWFGSNTTGTGYTSLIATGNIRTQYKLGSAPQVETATATGPNNNWAINIVTFYLTLPTTNVPNQGIFAVPF